MKIKDKSNLNKQLRDKKKRNKVKNLKRKVDLPKDIYSIMRKSQKMHIVNSVNILGIKRKMNKILRKKWLANLHPDIVLISKWKVLGNLFKNSGHLSEEILIKLMKSWKKKLRNKEREKNLKENRKREKKGKEKKSKEKIWKSKREAKNIVQC